MIEGYNENLKQSQNFANTIKSIYSFTHRWATGGFGGSDPPPLRLKIWVYPTPWKIFEQVTP